MTGTRSRALSLLTLGVLTLSLWSAPADARRKKREAAPPPAAEATSEGGRSAGASASAAAMAGLSMSATTELIDAGAEPRQTLRLHPTQGAAQEVELVMDMDMDMDMGGMSQKMDLPPMVMTMRAIVLSASPDGTMEVETTLLDSRVEGGGSAPAEVTGAMAQSFASMKGVVVRSRMDGTGRPLETSFSGVADPALRAAMDSFQQNMRQGQVMLPTEAVGAGAIWRTVTDINSSGIPMHAITTYTLRGVEGDRVTLGTAIEMSVDKGALLATMPGADVRFTRFESVGDGTVEWNLSQLMPLSTLRYTMDMVMETRQGEQTMTVGMALDMEMQMREIQR